MTDRKLRVPVTRSSILYAALFALAFAAASWFVPAAYYHLSAPSDHVEITELDVETAPDLEYAHRLEISVHAKQKYPVEATVTLYRHTDGDRRVSVREWSFTGILEPGKQTNTLPLDRSEPLRTGVYSYTISATIYTDYHAVKRIEAQTGTFEVVNPNATQQQTSPPTTETRTRRATKTRRDTVTQSATPTPTRSVNGTRTPTPTPTPTAAPTTQTPTPTPQPLD